MKEFTEKWKRFYMSVVYQCAEMSKDESTHIGAVVVGPDNEIRSTGYNSFPRGMVDDDPAKQLRPRKYLFFEHAERNAIYNATLSGVSLKDCTMFTNGVPCADCGRGVIQSGIRSVFVHNKFPRNGYNLFEEAVKEEHVDHWTESIQATLEMFQQSGVKVDKFEGELGRQCLFNGKLINV